MLSINPDLSAQDISPVLPDLDTSYSGKNTLLVTRPDMSKSEYNQAIRYNKRLLLHAVREYLEKSFTSLGMSETSQKITGAALGLIIQRGAKLNLNNNNSMYLEFDQLNDRDRSIYYKINYSW